MRQRISLVLGVVTLACAGCAPPSPPSPPRGAAPPPPGPAARAASAPDPAVLVARLGSTQWRKREAAERALYRLGEKAIPHLKASAQHPDAEVRHRSALVLRVLELVERLKQDHTKTLYYSSLTPTMHALVKLGPDAVPGLTAMTEHPDHMVAFSIATILGEMRDRQCGPGLRKLTHYDHPWVQTESVWALGNYAYPPAVPDMIRLLDSKHAKVVNEAILALEKTVERPGDPPPSNESGTEESRAKGIAKWKAWWKENSARYADASDDPEAPIYGRKMTPNGIRITEGLYVKEADGETRAFIFNGVKIAVPKGAAIAALRQGDKYELKIAGRTHKVPFIESDDEKKAEPPPSQRDGILLRVRMPVIFTLSGDEE